MLCAICISMFQGPSLEGDHHANFQDLIKAADSGCKICKTMCRMRDDFGLDHAGEQKMNPLIRFQFQRNQDDEDALDIGTYIEFHSELSWLDSFGSMVSYLDISSPQAAPRWWPGFVEKTSKDLDAEPWRVREDEFPQRSIAGNTGDEGVIQVAREWLESCKSGHETCETMDGTRNANYFPGRLLDISDIGSQTFRLVVTNNIKTTNNSRYVALSHCWGEKPSFLRLTNENMEELQQGVSLHRLPKSFRDAIHVSQQLGFRYIWIDSLCIIQSGTESAADWQAHSSTMDLIYTNCTLNLAVTRAMNAEQGAFVDRDQDFLQTAYVYAPAAMGLHKEHEQESIPGESVLITIYSALHDFPHTLWELPLQKRGWVVQERLMAPRTLHFGGDRVFWECNERLQNEYRSGALLEPIEKFPNRTMLVFSLPRNALKPAPKPLTREEERELHQRWKGLVNDYTTTELSFPNKDKLVAFAAVAKRFNDALATQYLAGLFASDVPLGLLWRQAKAILEPSQAEGWMGVHGWREDVDMDDKRDSVYRAPSWSWASVDGWVHFDVLDEPEKSQTLLVNVTAANVQLVDPHAPFGQVSSASITLEGPVSAFRGWNQGNEPDSDDEEAWERWLEKYENGYEIIALHVCVEQIVERNGIVPRAYGLALASSDGNTYRRMGLYRSDGPAGAQYPVDQFPRKTITVV